MTDGWYGAFLDFEPQFMVGGRFGSEQEMEFVVKVQERGRHARFRTSRTCPYGTFVRAQDCPSLAPSPAACGRSLELATRIQTHSNQRAYGIERQTHQHEHADKTRNFANTSR